MTKRSPLAKCFGALVGITARAATGQATRRVLPSMKARLSPALWDEALLHEETSPADRVIFECAEY